MERFRVKDSRFLVFQNVYAIFSPPSCLLFYNSLLSCGNCCFISSFIFASFPRTTEKKCNTQRRTLMLDEVLGADEARRRNVYFSCLAKDPVMPDTWDRKCCCNGTADTGKFPSEKLLLVPHEMHKYHRKGNLPLRPRCRGDWIRSRGINNIINF